MKQYYYKKTYSAGEAQIVFFKGTESDGIFRNVFGALSSARPMIRNIGELWTNNEMVVNVDSDLGNFVLSKDMSNTSCIVARKNAKCIEQIDQLLAADPMFVRAS
ncbi:hypothetical protein SAMN05421788_102530 [Filimonas lacunae]|uniref:Uncharacterized protein n=1 Tax=Filimonas lacunae TaxID=477680 RepID=A0A173MH63_9BACT|nr:hypothetical protein [Filimonas lacunae]BAV06836.1 hypothetical protein FLA_2856 [Filimonas lacunae]SIS99076.1 hypothetical protein SAMN05421788_102530 [Filimonas lacunae]